MIQIPDTKKGNALSFVRDRWWARYWVDGKQARKLLAAKSERTAKAERDKFFAGLAAEGATIRPPLTRHEKLERKPSLYVYRRTPYYVKIGTTLVGEVDTYDEAVALRDKYLAERIDN